MGAHKTLSNMTIAEENYWRGYIDAKVEGLGKSRTHEVSDQKKIEYRDKLLAEKGITGRASTNHFDWQLHLMFIMTGIALGIVITRFLFGGPVECWTFN